MCFGPAHIAEFDGLGMAADGTDGIEIPDHLGEVLRLPDPAFDGGGGAAFDDFGHAEVFVGPETGPPAGYGCLGPEVDFISEAVAHRFRGEAAFGV